jgi:hypothetical protein
MAQMPPIGVGEGLLMIRILLTAAIGLSMVTIGHAKQSP